jgi:hypothetical protein
MGPMPAHLDPADAATGLPDPLVFTIAVDVAVHRRLPGAPPDRRAPDAATGVAYSGREASSPAGGHSANEAADVIRAGARTARRGGRT